LRDFWLRQFRKYLEAEQSGSDPANFAVRWLALDAMTWDRRGPRIAIDIPEDVAHFLDDADIRAKDRSYADHQRIRVTTWLNAQ